VRSGLRIDRADRREPVPGADGRARRPGERQDVKASVGGKLAQIGSRLVDAAAKKVADDFFRNFNEKVAERHKKKVTPHETGHEDRPALERDPQLPTISDTTLMFFAAGSLVVTLVALIVLLD
jgi:hypothetical protein